MKTKAKRPPEVPARRHNDRRRERVEIKPGGLYSMSELIGSLRLGHKRLKGLLESGAIPASKDGTRWLVKGNDVLAWVRSKRHRPKAEAG